MFSIGNWWRYGLGGWEGGIRIGSDPGRFGKDIDISQGYQLQHICFSVLFSFYRLGSFQNIFSVDFNPQHLSRLPPVLRLMSPPL